MSPTNHPQAEATVEAYFAAVGRNDLAGIEAVLHDDFIQYPPQINIQQDRDAFLAEWSQRFKDSPDTALEYERSHRITEIVEAGSRAGRWVHEWGTYRRNDGGLSFKLAGSFHVRDGRLLEIHGYFDVLDIMTQMGFNLTPPVS